MIKMFSFRSAFRATLILFGLSCFYSSSFATPEQVVEKDGRVITTAPKVNPGVRSLTCGNVKAYIFANKHEDKNIHMMVSLGVQNGKKAIGYKLLNPFDHFLNQVYGIEDMMTGCLTDNGGIGFEFPYVDEHSPALYLQIDAHGRVFSGYDQVGLKLIRTKDTK